MKKRISVSLFVAIVLAATCVSAKEMSEDELRSVGGIVYRPDKGEIAILDAQSSISENTIRAFSIYGGKLMQLPFKYRKTSGTFSVATAAATVGAVKANAAIFIVEDPVLPMSLIAPEARWGVMNVAALKVDNPSAKLLADRADKMFTRVATQLLGGGNQDVECSAMQSVTTLTDLDAVKGRGVAMLSLPGLMNHVAKLGIELGYEATYEDACSEGWAPAPTNKYQKAIWDEVHQLPTKPIRILPETKPVKK